MILVDTSVWIRAARGLQTYAAAFDRIVDTEQALGHPLVYGELLIGDRGGRRTLLTEYARLAWAPPIAHREVVALVNQRGLQGRGLSWIDAHLLASALSARCRLWTADSALAAVAGELGVGWRPL